MATQPAASASLTELREQISVLDRQLLTLLGKRQQLILQVGYYKHFQQLPLHDPQREKQLLEMLIDIGEQQQLSATYVEQLYQVILCHSLTLQQNTVCRK